ncbi:MAG: hypothetical protein PHI34_09485 [Acidobacteriota bacterium]|nr:hypothetical protein [Acidobacteriota bacterium]
MKNKCRRFLAIGLWAAILLAAATGIASASERSGSLLSGARNVQSRTLAKTAAIAPGSLLKIEKTQANVTISAWDRNEVSAEAKVEVGDARDEVVKEFLDNTSLTLEKSASGLVLRLESPWNWEKGRKANLRWIAEMFRRQSWKLSYAARINIRVPVSLSLDLGNSFGDVDVRGLSGRLTVRNESGQVKIESAGGSLDLDNSFGDVRVASFKGSIDVHSESGAVVLENIGGAAVIGNSFKDIRFNKIDGPLTVTSESAAVIGTGVGGDCLIKSSFQAIDVRNIRGRCEIRGESLGIKVDQVEKDAVLDNSFKPLTATNIKGTLRITSESAGVTVADIGGWADITGSFQDIRAERIHGWAKVQGESCSVTLRDIDGDATVASTFKAVDIANVGGALEVRSESAPVTVVGVKKSAAVVTSFSSVNVRNVGGGLKVQGESTSVLAEDIGGPVDVKNSFKDVILRKTGGFITVVGESGGVDISQLKTLAAGSIIDVKTTFKPISLTLPAGTEIQGTARTEYGKIITDFPVYLLDNREGDGQAIEFRTGKGGITVKLETTAGITIKKSL